MSILTPEQFRDLRALIDAPEVGPVVENDWFAEWHDAGKVADACVWAMQRQMGRFLSALFSPYSDGFIELRAVPGDVAKQAGEKAVTRFVFLPDVLDPAKRRDTLQGVWDWASGYAAAGRAIYVGVLPRGRARGRAADIYQAGFIWADLDFKIGGPEAAFAAIDEHKPDIVVLSGYGAHAYWKLPTVRSLAEGGAKRFSNWLKRKQQEVLPGSDPVQDVARVLRLPGFLNWKQPEDPRPVVMACYKKREKNADPVG